MNFHPCVLNLVKVGRVTDEIVQRVIPVATCLATKFTIVQMLCEMDDVKRLALELLRTVDTFEQFLRVNFRLQWLKKKQLGYNH